MTKIVGAIMLVFFSCSTSAAEDIQLLNPAIFGEPTASAVKLLLDKKPDETEPYTVSTDIKCGKYIAASAFYPPKVTFAIARSSINKLYQAYENSSLYKENVSAMWRIEDEQFAISLIKAEQGIRIMYIKFMPTEEIFKNIMKEQGANVDAFEDDECKK